MAAFYTCSDCTKEFLGSDDIPIEAGDSVKPMCYRCQELYNYCIVCDSSFIFDSHSGDPTGDLCLSCWNDFNNDLNEGAAFL